MTALKITPYLLWAKLPRKSENSRAFHPLLCHMLDVAVVARLMWREVLSEAARRRVSESLRLQVGEAEKWIAYLAALHDLGKASPAFQLRKEARHLLEIYDALGKPPNVEAGECPHGGVTADRLPDIFVEEFGIDASTAMRLSVVIGGHHGTFPTSLELLRYPAAGVGTGTRWKAIRREMALTLKELIGVSKDAIPLGCDHAGAMFIAGLVSVADWVGSNNEFFPYFVGDFADLPTIHPSEYMRSADASAMRALSRLGWLGWVQPTKTLGFGQLFRSISSPGPLQQAAIEIGEELTPRPLQQAAIEIGEELTPPAIVIIEAPMGEGKTEAALYLADRWGVQPGPRGCYIALPTQATSNQMFTRMRGFLARRYPAERVNLQLLHGHAALSAEFQVMSERNYKVFELESICDDGGCSEHGASVVAAEWFTHRKRGLLAPFGVGTIDQALLAVLQTRHLFVRLFGLAHKIIILDEVHAYDAYMSKLLERLLEWLAALGSPVVLLSATLPRSRRQRLLKAYLRGLGRRLSAEEEQELGASYPLITWAGTEGQGARTIEVSDRIRRVLRIEWVDGRVPVMEAGGFSLGEKLQKALSGGGCAAVICNTVNRAQKVYRALRPYFADEEFDLFHARFLFKDRDEREKRSLLNFGKEKTIIKFGEGDERRVSRPYRKILIATQVIEQSLDLDFDLMVTDHAPVDLILQRSGRLHRHERPRPESLAQPILWICRPEEVNEEVPVFDRGTAKVYDEHMLLRSWLTLRDRETIHIPERIEELVESVYGERDCPDSAGDALREHWRKTADALRESLKGMEAEAIRVVVPDPNHPDDILDAANKRLEEDEPEIHKSLQALTRLTEPNVAVICLTPEQRGRFDLTVQPTIAQAKELLAYSVTISDSRVLWSLLKQKPPSAWSKSPLLRRYRLLELDGAGCCTVGEYRIRVDPELGIEIDSLKREAGKEP